MSLELLFKNKEVGTNDRFSVTCTNDNPSWKNALPPIKPEYADLRELMYGVVDRLNGMNSTDYRPITLTFQGDFGRTQEFIEDVLGGYNGSK